MDVDIDQIKVFVILLKLDDKNSVIDEKRFTLSIPANSNGQQLFERSMAHLSWETSDFSVKSFRKYIKEFEDYEDCQSLAGTIVEPMQKYEFRLKTASETKQKSLKPESSESTQDEEFDIIEQNVSFSQHHSMKNEPSEDEIEIPISNAQGVINQNLSNKAETISKNSLVYQEEVESEEEYYDIGRSSISSSSSNNVCKENLKRKSLGRRHEFGELYNAITDNFLGSSLLEGTRCPLAAIQSEPIGKTNVEILDNLSLKGKITLLQLEDELALSYICGMAEPKGFATFITQNQPIENQAVFSLLFSYTSQVDKLNLSHPKFEPIIKSKADFVDNSATHIVVGVEYGIVMPMTIGFDWTKYPLENVDQFNEYVNTSIGLLQDKLKGKTVFLIENSIELFFKHCASVSVFMDDQRSPTTLKDLSLTEAINKILGYSKSLKFENNNRGIPIGYQLQPLFALFKNKSSNLQKFHLISQIDQLETISAFIQLFKFLDRLAYFSSFLQKNEAKLNHSVISNALRFQADIHSEAEIIKKKLQSDVKEIRMGRSCTASLHRINEGCTTLIEKITLFLTNKDNSSLKKRIDFINKLISEKSILYVGKDDRWQDQLNDQEDYYVFFASLENRDHDLEGCIDHLWSLLNHGKLCMFVDQEVTQGRFPGQNRLCLYQQGHCFIEDMIKLKNIEEYFCLAMPSMKFVPARSPNNAVELTMKCPNSIYGSCDPAPCPWMCHYCGDTLKFGFDGFFYCGCGKAPSDAYSYHCNDLRHGIDYVSFEQEDLTQEIGKMKPHRVLNILLLGETGVGKSTFINGFTNYLNFLTLEQAQISNPFCLIPCHFKLIDDNDQERLIKITNPDSRECLEEGQSSTQDPLAHVFEARNMTIRLIDTPGIGDVRGVDQDKKNMDAILRYIENVDEIHGICILLKSNNARLNVIFKFCMNELLSHLHKDAAKNIVFCFTNTSGTFYRPGDTLTTLKKHLENLKEGKILEEGQSSTQGPLASGGIEVPLKYFCFDNEAFRFLMACQNGVQFSKKDQLKYQESWERAESETVRLLDYICQLDPHPVRDTVSVNEARRIILTLAKPMAEITSSIQSNIRAIEAKRSELATLNGSEQDLQRRLMIPQITVVAQQLDYPRTVCTSESCTDTKALPNTNVVQTIYVTHCHVHCNLDGVLREMFPNPKLLDCVAIEDEHCRCCGCRWELHMHITYDQEIVEAMIEDPNVRRLLDTNQNSKVAINEVIKNCDEQIICYKSEQERITDISVKFGSFLKKNAMMTYNDAYEAYVNHLIEEEKRRADHLQDKEKVRRLEKMIEEYREKRRVIQETGREGSNVSITPEAIHSALRDLFNLPLTGDNIKHLFETASDAQRQHFIHAEQRFQPEPMDVPDGDEALIELLKPGQKNTAFFVHGSPSLLKRAYNKLVNLPWPFKKNEEKKNKMRTIPVQHLQSGGYYNPNRPGSSKGQQQNKPQQNYQYLNKPPEDTSSWYSYF